jgi:ABC-type sugar transport system permease subunit
MKTRQRSRQEKLRARAGWLFIMPWFIGTVMFFLQALVRIVQYAFSNLRFVQDVGMVLEPLNGLFANFVYVFTEDANFPQRLASSLVSMFYQIPIILVFSLFTAIVLNQNFHGRGFMRAVFFLPVIITSGVIVSVIRSSMTNVTLGPEVSNNIFNTALLTEYLIRFGLPRQIINAIGGFVSNVTDLIWKSGVQILVFLMGILSIPETYYSVAQVEGASGWETFCWVIIPSVKPYILLNFVYTMIDIFVSFDNSVMRLINNLMLGTQKSYAAAMALSYFVIVAACMGAILGVICLWGRSHERRKKY